MCMGKERVKEDWGWIQWYGYRVTYSGVSESDGKYCMGTTTPVIHGCSIGCSATVPNH